MQTDFHLSGGARSNSYLFDKEDVHGSNNGEVEDPDVVLHSNLENQIVK